MNVGVRIYVWVNVFEFSGYILRRGVAGPCGGSVLNILRNLHTVLHSGCTSFHSHLQRIRLPFPPQPLQHLLSLVIQTAVSCYLIRVLINVSLIASAVEHIFITLLAIVCLLGVASVQVPRPFLIGLFFLFGVQLCEVFTYFGYEPLVGAVACVHLFPLGALPFDVVFRFILLGRSFLVWHNPIHLFLPLFPLSLGSHS